MSCSTEIGQNRDFEMVSRRMLSYWLVPAEPHHSYFESVIDKLAKRFNGKVFGPHVTVYAGSCTEEQKPGQKLGEMLDECLKGVEPITLQATGLEYLDIFTKTLFLQFEQHEVLANLSQRIKEQFAAPAPEDYELDPHLSLLYRAPGEISDVEKETSIAELAYQPTEVRFDRIAIIAPAAGAVDFLEIGKWEILHTATLAL